VNTKEKQTHQPCPDCGSSDALQINDNGNTYCHSCHKATIGHGNSNVNSNVPSNSDNRLDEISKLSSGALTDRGIDNNIASLFGCKVEYNQGTRDIEKHYYPYYKKGSLSGYKVRGVAAKLFYSVGDVTGVELYGQSLCSGGKLIIVTEGECDAMAAKQMLKECGKDYSVVSVATGTSLSSIKD